LTNTARNFETEASKVYESISTSQASRVPSILHADLERIRNMILDEAKSIGKQATRTQYEEFKEAIHEAYVTIGAPFLGDDFFVKDEQRIWVVRLNEIAWRVYHHMLGTTETCKEITGYDFDEGLEYASIGTAEFWFRNFEKSFAYMELAHAEDARIAHEAGVADRNLKHMLYMAYDWIYDMISVSRLPAISRIHSICESKLDWTLKCRVAKCLWKFRTRIKDDRSSLNKDDLERNLLDICKIIENYLKRNKPIPNLELHKQTLNRLIEHAFRNENWYDDWKAVPKHYDGSKEDDKQLIDIIFDASRRYEANVFLVLSIVRVFSAHVFNDQSDLFLEKNYDKAFSMCVEALMYTLTHV